MEPLEIARRLEEAFADEVLKVETFRDQVGVTVRRDRIRDICAYLRDRPELDMTFLADLCGLEPQPAGERFEVVYNLYSLQHRHRIRLKARVPASDPSIDSVVSIWTGANWFEREAWDMYGISFRGHPDLRRLLMPEGWEGHPLRKDYPLKGPEGWEDPGYEEAVRLHRQDDELSVK